MLNVYQETQFTLCFNVIQLGLHSEQGGRWTPKAVHFTVSNANVLKNMGLCCANHNSRERHGDAWWGCKVSCYFSCSTTGINKILSVILMCYCSFVRLLMKLYKPMVLEKGQRFTLRDGFITLGTGVITGLQKNLTEHEKLLLFEGKKGVEKRAKKEAAGKA